MDDDAFSQLDGIFAQLGIDPASLLQEILVFVLPFTVLCVWATSRVRRRLSGREATFWLFFIWIVPIAGPIFALIATRKAPPKADRESDLAP